MKADAMLVRRMKSLSQKRNATSYDSAGNVSAQELDLAIRTAEQLRRTVIAWLEQSHPDLFGE